MFAKPRPKKDILPPVNRKRKAFHAVEEVTFDRDARADYLTGFHKRKQARIKHAQQVAEEKARQDKIQMRKQAREERKQAVEEHVQMVHKMLREAEQAGQGDLKEGQDEDDDEWSGIEEVVPEEPPIDREEEYVDEDRYTTVTIEAVSVDRDGLHKATVEPEEDEEEATGYEMENAAPEPEAKQKQKAKKGAPERPKKKKQKFRYESKLERKAAERKMKARKARR